VFPKKRTALENLRKAERWVDERGLHTVTGPGGPRGVILSGMVALSVADVLEGLLSRPDVLKLAMPYPMPSRVGQRSRLEYHFFEGIDEGLVVRAVDGHGASLVACGGHSPAAAAPTSGKMGIRVVGDCGLDTPLAACATKGRLNWEARCD
jgi:hypothetical protein